jgi:predicted MPP superfamily phosphohydrolase
MTLFFIIFFAIYSAVNFYIFIRGWQAISHIPILKPFYIIIFLLSALAYIIAKIFNSKLPALIYDILLWPGSFWFAFMLYFFLFIVLIDFSRLLNYLFSIYPSFITSNFQTAKLVTFISVILISSIIIIAGYLNTRNIKINHVEIEIPRKASKLGELNVVLVADFHLNPVNDGNLLDKIVRKINELNADIVLIPGDIVDDRVEILKRKNIGKELSEIKSKYGVYVSNGNHEFINGVEGADKYLREFNLNVLRDSAVLIENSFYILGREDRSKPSFTNKRRKSLGEILKEVDRSFPVIVIDHTPLGFSETVEENIELQLSGHTHHGQMFPLNFITNMIYEVSWGYLKKEKTQFYVTCGVGTWGPPVRLGSDSEIVKLAIRFVK